MKFNSDPENGVWFVQAEGSFDGRIVATCATSGEAEEFMARPKGFFPEGLIYMFVPNGYRFDQRPHSFTFKETEN